MRPPLRLDSEPTSGAILGKFFTGKRLKPLGETKGIVQELLTKRRRVSPALEAIDIRLVKIAQGLLQRLRMHIRQKAILIAFSPQCHKLAGVRKANTWRFEDVSVFIRRKYFVPNETARTCILREFLPCIGIRLETVLIAFA
jgi:hypothetical protein